MLQKKGVAEFFKQSKVSEWQTVNWADLDDVLEDLEAYLFGWEGGTTAAASSSWLRENFHIRCLLHKEWTTESYEGHDPAGWSILQWGRSIWLSQVWAVVYLVGRKTRNSCGCILQNCEARLPVNSHDNLIRISARKRAIARYFEKNKLKNPFK